MSLPISVWFQGTHPKTGATAVILKVRLQDEDYELDALLASEDPTTAGRWSTDSSRHTAAGQLLRRVSVVNWYRIPVEEDRQASVISDAGEG